MPPANSTSTPIQIDPVWEQRWTEQAIYLGKLTTFYEENLKIPRVATLHALTQCLKAFAEKQVNFFIHGFSQDKLKSGTKECQQFPPEAVMAIIFDQISFDISIIERAAEQRIGCYQQYQINPDNLVYKALNIGDHLAYEALQQAQTAHLLREQTTVVTYLHKSPLVRVIPYAPVVLVGIPHTCIGISRDFLAIPHEVGHYVYRHGRFKKNGQQIIGKFPVAILPSGLNTWAEVWFEEVFADVFGALVAGPVIGIDFQDLQMTSKTGGFYTDDDEHPTPILRPHIYNNVINLSASEWSGKLVENWKAYLQTRDNFLPSELRVKKTGRIKRKFKRKNGHKFDVDEAISTSPADVPDKPTKPLDIAVDCIRSQLLVEMSAQSWPANLAPPKENEKAQDLYTKFENFIGDLQPNKNIPELSLDANQNIKVGEHKTQRKAGATLFPNRVDSIRSDLDNLKEISCQEWLSVLAAAGWATRGPDCESTGGVCAG